MRRLGPYELIRRLDAGVMSERRDARRPGSPELSLLDCLQATAEIP